MAWRVNYIDVMVLPLAVGRSTLDRDALLSFELHAVHGCSDVVTAFDFVHFGNAASVEENAFCERGLTRIDVRGDSNVTHDLVVDKGETEATVAAEHRPAQGLGELSAQEGLH